MNKQQADYCDALSSGNVETWSKGSTAVHICNEWIQIKKDQKKTFRSVKVVKMANIAVNVADKAIMRMMGNG